METRAADSRKLALRALLLLVPVPTLGALCAFVWAPGPLGQALYFAGKLWLVGLPLYWRLRVDREPLSLSPLAPGRRLPGLAAGLLLGAAMAAAVFGAFELLGETWIDLDRLREAERAAGLNDATRFIAFAAYLILVNSAVEEFVWRWFCLRHCAALLPAPLAVVASALFFTLHHAVVFSVQFDARTAALASFGVFAAGCIWAALYSRFRSIWPGYLSHVGADIAGLWIGWELLF